MNWAIQIQDAERNWHTIIDQIPDRRNAEESADGMMHWRQIASVRVLDLDDSECAP